MEKIKFFFQYLFSPIIIAIVGGVITYNIQIGQRHLETMKFTEQVIKDVFDTSNISRGLAILLLVKPALEKDSPEFADSLIHSISVFYASRIKEDARSGNVSAIRNIQAASEDIGGVASEIATQIKASQVISKTQQAIIYEHAGIDYLNANKIHDAKIAFASAEKSYPGFHNSYEISKLLTSAEATVKTRPEYQPVIADSVRKIIKTRYSWGIDRFH